MSDAAWCYLALVTGLAVLAVITKAVLSAPRSTLCEPQSSLVDCLRQVVALWRSCASGGERFIVFWSITLHLIRGGILAFLAAVIGAVISMSLSLCGMSPQTVDRILEFLRDLLDVPPRRVTP